MLANDIYRRKRVKNSEILELLIYGAYIEEQSKLQNQELNIFRQEANYYYQQGQKEVKKDIKVKAISDNLFDDLIDIALITGFTWKQYIDTILKYNAEQIYKQVVIDITQNKELNIYSDIYQHIINKQQNSKLNINENKYSGAVDNYLIGMNNQAKINGILEVDKEAKVRFIAVEDNVTTKMCKSLNGQVFKIQNWNEFYRYSATNKSQKKYRCYGLIQGLNLPPIDDNFHWCRSSITYQV